MKNGWTKNGFGKAACWSLVVGLCLVAAQTAIGTVVHVYPEDDLQAVVDQAEPGDELVVYPGDYDFTEDDLIISKDLVIRNWDPNYLLVAEITRLYGCIQFDESVTEACVLNGFTFTGLNTGVLRGNRSTPTIQNCIFQGNGPCDSLIKGCDGLFLNCLIADNQQFQDCGSPDPVIYDCEATFINCTIVNNRNGMGLEAGFIENCIITGNEGDQIVKYGSDGSVVVQYSNLQDWSDLESQGVITLGLDDNDMLDVDPNFVKEGSWDANDPTLFFPGDYHLKCKGWRWMKLGGWTQDDWTSYCVDAGNPDSAYLNNEYYSELRAENDYYDADDIEEGWNPAVNLGFYGGTFEASVLPDEETPLSSNWGSGQGGGALLVPDPAEWDSEPQEKEERDGPFTSVCVCSMTAKTVTSSTGNPIYYKFECDTVDGHDSDWATRRTYEFTIDNLGDTVGLQFRVKAWDKEADEETEWSDWATVSKAYN